MADSLAAAEQRAAEKQEQRNLERVLSRPVRHPTLQARLKGVASCEVVEIAAAEGYEFGVFILPRTVCTGDAMAKVQQGARRRAARAGPGGSPPCPLQHGPCMALLVSFLQGAAGAQAWTTDASLAHSPAILEP